MQREIKSPGPLLDAQGHLREVGFAKSLLLSYDRKAVKASPLRIKEWDYYLVTNGRYALALTIADNSYMGLLSVSLLDFERPWFKTTSVMSVLPRGKTGLPASSKEGDVSVSTPRVQLAFTHEGGRRHLTCHMADFEGKKPILAEVWLGEEPEESMVIATPFAGQPDHFYYNQKINCMKASGNVHFDGRDYPFDEGDAVGTLDWGRGVWPYQNTWYWGSASGYVGGASFGFNIGYGFGDTSAASENMLFYKGKAHKLERVTFHIPTRGGREDYLSPWEFTSSDGRFEMDFLPILDRMDETDALVLCSKQHQVFGRFTGTAILDDGSVIEVKDLLGFAEKVQNRW